MKLNLTPEEEKLAKETLAKDGQTPEEIFMWAIYHSKKNRLPKIATPPESAFVEASVDENGVLVIPESAPEELKDWVKHG